MRTPQAGPPATGDTPPRPSAGLNGRTPQAGPARLVDSPGSVPI